ncbi:BACON domain-containing protein [Hyphomonas adhaerens]|uniref:BACON domain-containing protein n=1 Tax=Hyphomonas adhaerens TaxID=81029 RepID=UPI000A012D93|nr:BACON domain-containing carbohydrate-binding protein [Hyphomonas adhaerens]
MIDANHPEMVIATGTTSTVDGSFDLEIDGSVDFDGGVVKVIVTGGDGVMMICDAPSGCFGTPFGGQVEISADFELAALVEAPADGGSLTVHVNAITTLATALAEFNANGSEIDQADLIAVNDQVAGLFGLESTDLWNLPGIDITDAGTGEEPSADALRAAYINAGILESLVEGYGSPTLEQRLDTLLTDFTENSGQLIMNEDLDNPWKVSLEDIFDGAYSAIDESPREDEAGPEVATLLEANFLAISAAEPDTRTQDLPERPVLAASPHDLSFSGINGRSVPGAAIEITGEGILWSARANEPWLSFDQRAGVGDATITVFATPGLAPLGHTQGSFTIFDTAAPKEITVNVDFNVGDALKLPSYDPVVFNTVEQSTQPLTQDISLLGENISWKATSDQSWISVNPSTGTSPGTISLNADPSGLAEGVHTAYVKISDTDFDQELTIQADLRIEPRQIRVEETGVSFSSFPDKSILTRQIDVTENLGQPLEWTASSNASWLSVTPSGQTDGMLTLEADPTGLSANQLYTAQVELRATDADVTNTEHINVSLWVGDTNPLPRIELDTIAKNIVADPVRPYIYVNAGGDSDIQIINVYTGESAGIIRDTTTSNGVMAVSPDGEVLYVYETSTHMIVPVDLTSHAVGEGWLATYLKSIAVQRVDGKEVLFTGAPQAYDARTGVIMVPDVGMHFYETDNSVAVSKDGETMCVMTWGLNPYSVYCFDVSYSYLEDGELTLNNRRDLVYGVGATGQDLAVSNDGSLVYPIAAVPSRFSVFDTDTMEEVQSHLLQTSSPTAGEIGPNGIFYGGIDENDDETDVWAIDSEGNIIATYNLAGSRRSLLAKQLVVSGDGTRLIGSLRAFDFDPVAISIVSTN